MFDPMEFEIDEPEKVVYVVGIGPGDRPLPLGAGKGEYR